LLSEACALRERTNAVVTSRIFLNVMLFPFL
jgi:hypothetical protein